MRFNKSIVYPLALLLLAAAIIVVFNYNYFEYLVNDELKYSASFNLISGFVGGDARHYYNLDNDIFKIIYAGVLAGSVDLGSILSLIGIYLYVEMSRVIFSNEIIGVLILNLLLFSVILVNIQPKNLDGAIALLVLFPFTLNYVLVPNKEIFGLLILVLFASKKFAFKPFLLAPISIIRDIFAAQILWFAAAYMFGWRLMFLVLFIVLPFMIPEGYFRESNLIEGQQSGSITNFANMFLQIPIACILGIIIKIILGLFSGLVLPPVENFTIIEVQYFWCALINLRFLAFILFKRNFRTHLLTDDRRFSIACALYASFMCLAPGNPARFLCPLTFMFLYKLIVWRRY